MTIELMKMLTPVPSPAAGTVEAVSVEIDQFVDEGELLLLLTT